jgi:lysophospholipase L1-like esterase
MKINFTALLSILLSSITWTQAQIVYPPVYPAVCNNPYKIVILGSSTAYGSGATHIDSSWARKLAGYVSRQNSQSTIVNLGLPGYTSYHLMPTGYIPPAFRPFAVDVTRNITAALALNPDAIILNLPSNDIGLGVTVAEVKANFDLMVAKADSAKVPVWVTTTQPRNNLSPAEKLMQVELKDWILQRYGNKAVDFWTDIANPDHTINIVYSALDNVHVNNAGHHLFFTRIVEEKIWDSICLRRNGNPPNSRPVAVAGNDIAVTGIPATVQLNASGSNDPEGAPLTFKWNIIAGTGGAFNNSNIVNPIFSSNTTGQFRIVLTVTDNAQLTGTDTLMITIDAANVFPVANAGADKLIHLPPNMTGLNGSASFDSDGSITAYKWTKIAGPAMVFSNDAIANPSVNSLTFGVYRFELMVTDNKGATAKDTMVLTVNNPPVANAGADKLIHLPPNTTTLNGNASSDPDGAIASWKWRKITGPTMVFPNDAIANPSANSLTYGVYTFELIVTDNNGAIAKDTMVLTVNNPPVANAGANAAITLPISTVTLSGTASTDVDGSISSYSWRQVSGAVANITSPSLVQTVVTFTAADTYQFELTVTDNRGGLAKDSVDIIVSPSIPDVITSSPQSLRGSAPLVVYPNPGTDIIYLKFPPGVTGPYKLDLVSLNGQTVMQKAGTKRNIGSVYTDQMNIRHLLKGIYWLKVRIQNRSMSSTIIKL